MADVPTWSSSTSYYAGRRDDDWDDRSDSYGQPAYGQPAYGQPGHGGQPNGWGPPARSGRGAEIGHDGYPGPDAQGQYPPAAAEQPYATRSALRAQARQATHQRGVAGWVALLVLLAIAGVGGVIDVVSGSNVRGGFNIALVLGSLVAIVIVRHRDMFPIVVAPPLVYIVASGAVLYIRSGGLHDRKILIDSAANWLVYGFPAIAGASAIVLIIAGCRLVFGR